MRKFVVSVSFECEVEIDDVMEPDEDYKKYFADVDMAGLVGNIVWQIHGGHERSFVEGVGPVLGWDDERVKDGPWLTVEGTNSKGEPTGGVCHIEDSPDWDIDTREVL